VALALVAETVGKDEVGQWMGTALSSSSVGLVISPLLGGIVYAAERLWAVLGMMLGLVFINLCLIGGMIEKHRAEDYYVVQQQPFRRYSTFTDDAGERPDHTTSTHTEETEEPKLPEMAPLLRLIRNPRILAGAYGVFTQFGLLASFDAFLPLFVKRRFGWGSLGAGLIFLCIAIPALSGPLAGKISDRWGPRRVALAGCILTTPPLVLLRLVGHDTQDQVVLLCGLLVLIGTWRVFNDIVIC